MITDQPNTGDGDIRQGGGRNAPKPPAPAAPVPVKMYVLGGSTRMKRALIIAHVQKAMKAGLSMESAVVGLGVSAATVRRWCGERDEVSS